MLSSLFGVFENIYLSPGIQVGLNSSKEIFFSYQTTIGLIPANDIHGIPEIAFSPGITFGVRHYKTGIKEWKSYNYIDAQITYAPNHDDPFYGTGIGVIFDVDDFNKFYKYKLFSGWFGLATFDYIPFKDKAKIHLGAFGVVPMFFN